MKPTAIFADHLRGPDPWPETLALDVARLVYPELDAAYYLGLLDALADMAAHHLLNELPGRATAVALVQLIHDRLGFRGNLEDYYDPRNSLLPDVLERRLGLPIMLSLLCMAIGRRLRLRIHGIGFPAHFMAGYEDDAGVWLLDPFYGTVIAVDDAEAYLGKLLNRAIRIGKETWRPITPRALAYRILNNLRNAFAMQENPFLLLKVLDFLVILDPAEPQHWRQRGLLLFQAHRWEEAQLDLRRYFIQKGYWGAVIQPSNLGVQVEQPENMPVDDRRLVAVYQKIDLIRSRTN